MTPVLSVEGLRKAYGPVLALNGVDFTAAPGEIVGLLGPNGAGKTTLVSIICGLRRADAGRVVVNGVDALAHPQQARRYIGLAPQELGIYPIDSVRQNLSVFGAMAGLRGRELEGQVETAAAALRLEDLLDRKAGQLSGGQKRRLHTAVALLGNPPLILLDEATTGADVESRAALMDVVKDLAARGSAVVYSTHYLQEIESLEARVVILDRGRAIANGSVRELVSSNGGGVVELTFRGQPPELGGGFISTYIGEVMRVKVNDPGQALGPILEALGPEAVRLRGVELIEPSLETVYLALTGRRYQPGEESDVLAS
ncbi:MAG: ABC transporter ATP-binding protein [Acidimicrobiia bacterium]